MGDIDDSALLHYSKGYDPVKAREYYLRTRQLRGRPRTAGTFDEAKGKKYYRQVQKAQGKETQKAQREALEEQKAALRDRVERLNDLLAELVKAAKSRSGIETKAAPVKSDPEDTSQDKATRNESAKKDTPLTTSQKREKAEKAREEYAKENPGPSLSKDVQQLRAKVEAVKAQIEKARREAANNPPKQANQTARSGR